MVLFRFFYLGILVLLSFSKTHAFAKTDLRYYQIAHRYTCAKTYIVLYERPLLFMYEETDVHGMSFNINFTCAMNTIVKSRDSGIIATVQRMKLRRTEPTKCRDFLKYNVDETLRCGDMRYGMETSAYGKVPPPPRIVSLYSGPFSFGSSVSSEFVSPGNVVLPNKHLVSYINIDKWKLNYGEELKIYVAYTAYIDCDEYNVTKGWFNCGYGVCISERLVFDGVVNCPFGDCIDEGGCEETIKGYPQLTGMFMKRTSLTKAMKESGPPYPVIRIPPKKKEISATKRYKGESECNRPIIGPVNRNRPGSRTRHRPHHSKLDDAETDEFFLKVYLNILKKMKLKDITKNQKEIVKRVSQYLLRTNMAMWNETAETR